MAALRTFAVGLLISGCLMLYWAQSFAKWAAGTRPAAFFEALNTLSPTLASIVGAPLVVSVALVSLCLGAGLAIACLLYAPLDKGVGVALRGMRR